MSLSMTVGTLWATVITVHSANSCLITLCRMASVAESMDAVASSRTRILFLLSRTLPRQNNCLCPKLQFPPSSLTAKLIRIRLSCHIYSLQNHMLNNRIEMRSCCFNDYTVSSMLKDLPEESKRLGSLLIVSLSWHFSTA